MSIKQKVVLIGITIISFSAIIFLHFFGPSRRSFVPTPRVVLVNSGAQIIQAWESNKVNGRILISFTRFLNAHESKNSTDINAAEISLNRNILRKIIHVPPDRAWPEIQEALSRRSDMRRSSEGFIGVYDDGRVYIKPFSRLDTIEEKALVVIEPRIWTDNELLQIAEKLKSNSLYSDLILIIRGSEHDATQFYDAMIHKHKQQINTR